MNLDNCINYYINANQEFHIVLKWLWDIIMNFILNIFKSNQIFSFNIIWIRIWWFDNNLINILFLYITKYYNIDFKNAMICVISSYIPIIKILVYIREKFLRIMISEF